MRSPSLPAHHHKARPNPHKVILEYKVSQQPPSIQPPRSGHLQVAPLAFVAAAFRGWRFFLCSGRPSYRPPPKNKKATQRVASSQKTLQSKTISSKSTRP